MGCRKSFLKGSGSAFAKVTARNAGFFAGFVLLFLFTLGYNDCRNDEPGLTFIVAVSWLIVSC